MHGEAKPEVEHEPYLVTKNEIQKTNGTKRKVWIRYHHPTIESSHVSHFWLKDLKIVTIEEDHFFEEIIYKNGTEAEYIIGIARKKLTAKEKLNLAKKIMTDDLISHYFLEGSPDTLHIQKSFHHQSISV